MQHARIVSELVSEFGGDDIVALAGLFHDAGHSCSASVPDHTNLARAIRRLDAVVSNLKDDDHERLYALIIATHSGVTNLEYDDDDDDEDAKMLRDADTLAGYVLDERGITSEDVTVAGLRAEGYADGSLIDFVRMRALHSQAARKAYGHLLTF